MRILYDGYIYKSQVAGGINRYFSEIIRGLPANFNPYLTTTRINKHNFPEHPNLKIFKYHSFRPWRISQKVEKIFFKAVLATKSFDVGHPTYYNQLTTLKNKFPVVLTVWDMIHELYPEEMDPKGIELAVKHLAIKEASKIICISENTKKDLVEILKVPAGKITVTPLAASIDEAISLNDLPVIDRPYYLYVGSRAASYKNFKGLLEALAVVVEKRKEIALCVAGPAFNQQEMQLISTLNLERNVKLYTQVSDTHLAKLYRCSIGLVYPSFYEGFGIPPLEAMACGTAVIASNRASIPEVVGEAGLLFDPTSIDALVESLLFLADNPRERDKLVAKGRQRTKLFSWEQTAKQTIEVYNTFRK